MLINVVDPEEIRVAILDEEGALEEFYLERSGGGAQHGNIYKGKVQNVEPSLEAAFVIMGGEKNGFLHASDVVPPHGGYEGVLKKRRRKKPKDMHRMPIDQMLYKGQEVLVQVTRESLHNKGPSLTTYVSLPGRYLVLMPAVQKRGVSKRITDEKERKELMKSLKDLAPPDDLGFIIRTAGMGRGKEELKRDLDYLLRLWEAMQERAKTVRPPALIYQESDLVLRAFRDYLYDDIAEVLIDSEEVYDGAVDFLEAVMPAFVERTSFYEAGEPLFSRYGVEDAIDRIFERNVPLASGGELVIEQTEALVAIDVNTKRFRTDSSRETIRTINREAAKEIARQLRLRDVGGLIMIDFIDMDHAEDRRAVEEAFRQALRKDRARITTLPISSLGVMEMTRQRVRQSLENTLTSICPACGGTGRRKGAEVTALALIRQLRALVEEPQGDLRVRLHPEAALPVSNARRKDIAALESEKGVRVEIQPDPSLLLDGMRFEWIPRAGGHAD